MSRSALATANRRSTLATLLLIALLAILATLQYRWTGEIERAEEERARAALSRTAWAVSGELEAEIGRLYGHFFPFGGAPEAMAERLATWRATAVEPRLLRGVFLLHRTEEPRSGAAGAGTLEQWDEGRGAFVPAEWPTALAPLRDLLSDRIHPPLGAARRPFGRGSRPGPAGFEGLQIPALIGPLAPLAPTPPPAGAREPGGAPGRPETPGSPPGPPFGERRIGEGGGVLLLWLDTNVVGTVILPEILARHFGALGAEGAGRAGIDYRIEVRDEKGNLVYSRGPAQGRGKPDAETPLFVLHGPPRFGERQSRPPFGSPSRFRRPPPPGSGEGGAQWQLRVTHPAGSLSAAVALARYRNLAISLAILILLAITLALALSASRRAQALARRQIELVAGISHELLTPVAALRSAGENLAAGVVHEPEQVRRYGDLLVREASRLGSLVEQVLTWAGLQTRGLPAANEPIDARALLLDVAAACDRAAHAAGVEIEVAAADGVPAVRGDRAALERALRNLVENALKYGTDGAGENWIGLGADPVFGVHSGAHSGARRRAPGVALWVEDHGPGIADDDLPHLFEPFFRGRQAGSALPGSGMGLALVRQIVQDLGGRVRVAPVAPRGVRFTLELPVWKGPADGR